jgi:uncharacterized membrane protein
VAKEIQGVAKEAIEEHEEAAWYAFVSMIILGVLSIAGAYLTHKKISARNMVAVSVLILSLLCFVIGMRTGWLGGQIRHNDPKEMGAVPPCPGAAAFTFNV